MQIDKPIVIAVMLLVSVFLVFFLVVPQYREFKQLQVLVGQKQAEYDAQYVYFSEIAKTYHDLESRADILTKIDDALPSTSAFGEMMYFFHQKAAETGLAVKSLFLSGYSTPAKGNVKEITFSIDMAGSYLALKSFIGSLERSSRLFEITSISFSAPVSLGVATPLTGQRGQPVLQIQSQQTYSFRMEVKANSY